MGSPWRDRISLIILELQEKGEIQMLYDKWWKADGGATCQRGGPGGSHTTRESSKANAMGVANIGGVFVVLLAGLAVAMIVAVAEFCHNARHHRSSVERSDGEVEKSGSTNCGSCWNNSKCSIGSRQRQRRRRNAKKCGGSRKQSLCAEMSAELRFALRCGGSRQRPAMRRSCSKCNVMMMMSVKTAADEKKEMTAISTTID